MSVSIATRSPGMTRRSEASPLDPGVSVAARGEELAVDALAASGDVVMQEEGEQVVLGDAGFDGFLDLGEADVGDGAGLADQGDFIGSL